MIAGAVVVVVKRQGELIGHGGLLRVFPFNHPSSAAILTNN